MQRKFSLGGAAFGGLTGGGVSGAGGGGWLTGTMGVGTSGAGGGGLRGSTGVGTSGAGGGGWLTGTMGVGTIGAGGGGESWQSAGLANSARTRTAVKPCTRCSSLLPQCPGSAVALSALTALARARCSHARSQDTRFLEPTREQGDKFCIMQLASAGLIQQIRS